MSLVICFSGRIGSGKTSVSRSVADALGAAWTGFGDFMRVTAKERGLDASSREILQDLGAELIQTLGVKWLCEQVISHARWDGNKSLVIDGVRHVEVFDEIIRQLAQHPVLLIHLDFDGSHRNAGSLDAASRQLIEQHSTERDVLGTLPSRADVVICAAAPLDRVVAQALEFVGQRNK